MQLTHLKQYVIGLPGAHFSPSSKNKNNLLRKKFLTFQEMKPSSSIIKKILIFSQMKACLIYAEMKPCTFQPMLEKQKQKSAPRKFFILSKFLKRYCCQGINNENFSLGESPVYEVRKSKPGQINWIYNRVVLKTLLNI